MILYQTIKRKSFIAQSKWDMVNKELDAFLTQSPPNQKSVKRIILYHTKMNTPLLISTK